MGLQLIRGWAYTRVYTVVKSL